MNIALPLITLVVGLIGGFFIGVYYLRRQMTTMQNDPEMLQKVAKQMGYNLNGKQMQRAQQMLQNKNPQAGRPGAGKGHNRKSR
jgi:uncharacterized protein YneF (UPF0154 family)